ncbi:MAG: hypothetical protein AB1489_29245 [Acidobacteriota bacterium]
MNSLLRPFKRVILVAVVVCGLLGYFASTTANSVSAYPTGYREIEYYLDSSYQQYCGTKIVRCNGSVIMYGTTGPYSVIVEQYSCSGPIP